MHGEHGWIVQLIGVAAVIVLAHAMSALVRKRDGNLFHRIVDALLGFGCFCCWVLGVAYVLMLGIGNLAAIFAKVWGE